MKKLVLILAVLILAAGICFAQEEDQAPPKDKPEFFDLEISVGVPVHWTNSPAPHKHWEQIFTNATGDPAWMYDEDKTVTANTAIGAALMFNFSRKFGVTLDADFFYAADVMGHSPTNSYSHTIFGANALLGPVFFLYNSGFLRIPLAIGIHMYYWGTDTWMPFAGSTEGTWLKTRDLQLGPGIYLGIQFHFNNSIYIFSRTNVSLDLFRWHQVVGAYYDGAVIKYDKSWTETVIAWSVKPTLGLGIKF